MRCITEGVINVALTLLSKYPNMKRELSIKEAYKSMFWPIEHAFLYYINEK